MAEATDLLHPRVSVNSLCFPDADLAAMAGHWRAVGAQRISLVSDLIGDEFGSLRGIIDAGGHQLEAITHLFFGVQNLCWDKERWEEERSRLHHTIDIAERLGAHSIYLMTGGHAGMVWEEAADCFSQAVGPCVARAQEAGVKLLIETTSPFYADGHLSHTLRDTIRLAEMADLGVCIDIWACWTEAGLRESIDRAASRCDLVQVSDYVYGDRAMPCRAVPGDGDIPLARILGWILDAGYTGAFDLELIGPRIDELGHREAARRAGEVLGELIGSDLGPIR